MFWVVLALALVPEGWSFGTQDAERMHPGLGHTGRVYAVPSSQQLTRKYLKRIQRSVDDLQGEDSTSREKAMARMLTDLIEAEQFVARHADTKSDRRIEDREEARNAALYMESQWVKWCRQSTRAFVGTWLTEQALGANKDEEERIRAMRLLAKAHHPDAKTLLLREANNENSPLRLAALRSMTHWPDEALDRHLVKGFTDSDESLGWDELLYHRIQGHGELHVNAVGTLPEELARLILDEDWRVAVSALTLTSGLPEGERLRALVLAVPKVTDAVKAGKTRYRVLADLNRALRDLTGRTMGADPRAWETFLVRYQEGTVELKSSSEIAADGGSQAEFFGIGRVSDHVTFVIDTSGSMESPFGTTGHTAYEEAVDQLLTYLERMGPETWFQVVVFNSRAETVFKLSQADEETLASLRWTMENRSPGGGTQLGLGVEEALKRNKVEEGRRKGRTTDTFVVLCDGATVEGADWAKALVGRPDFPKSLRFYSVQIGSAQSPAMRALAELTGGKFVRI